jgi:peptidoglycan/LPS O-acetylase OafA/YrhL
MLRGLAALAVAAFHVYGHTLEPTTGIKVVRFVSEWGWLGVPVFFVISGFVIPNSLRGDYVTPRFAANYALRRSLRLDPPYWFAIAIAVALQTGIDYLLHNPLELPSPGKLAAHAFYLQNILNLGNLTVGLWTLCLEVQFYVFFLALLALTQRTKISLALLVGLLGAGALCFSLDGDSDNPEVFTNAYRFLAPNFSMFAIGILAWMRCEGQLSSKAWLAVQVAVVTRLVVWFQPELLAAWLTGLAIVAQANGLLRVPSFRPLMFLGTISYSLYLIHFPVMRCVVLGLRRLTGFDGYSSLLMCTVVIALGILVAYLMYLLIERPSMRLAVMLRPARSPSAGDTYPAVTGLAPAEG